MSKIKLGLVNINNSFSNQDYFPYSVGILQAYAQEHASNIDEFEFITPIYKRTGIEKALEKLSGAGIVFFSVYVWNFRLSLEIARKLKQANQDIIIVFGGPHVPWSGTEKFMRANVFIDLACRGEGERAIVSILENYDKKDWGKVPSASFIDNNGSYNQTQLFERISDLEQIPSPYLEGVFGELIRSNQDTRWVALWETNRGCPFTCTYCDWGSATKNKVYAFDLERLFKEIEWFSQNKIEFVFCADANFGMLPRDRNIVEYFAEVKKKTGYPKALSVQSTKNFTEAVYITYKTMAESGLSKGVSLSLQSVNPDTLRDTRRQNISIDAFKNIQQKLTLDNVETFTDIILALPSETYDTFADGVSSVIENGQHNRIQFNNLSILPNAEMGDSEYQNKFGFEMVETDIINIHGSLEAKEEVSEKQVLVVGTKALPRPDWIRARVFGWLASLLHFDKLLQVVFIILHKQYSVSYRELIELFSDNENLPLILSQIRSFFIDKAIKIQTGGAEFCQSKKWLNIWWPADELMMIDLCAEGMINEFYIEIETVISAFLAIKNIVNYKDLLSESILLNKSLIKLPFQTDQLALNLHYNIWDTYYSTIRGIDKPLQEGSFTYAVDRTSLHWSNWQDWCREVIWYGNKKGAYIYNCQRVSSSKAMILK